MKKALPFILIFIGFLISCDNTSNEVKNTQHSFIDSIEPTDNSNEFLNLFNPINPKGLHFYSPGWDKNGELIKTPFEGKIIDVTKFSYIDDSTIFENIEAYKDGQCNIYAIGKFDINTKYFGLIVRQFSQYDESLIRLLLWDKKLKRILPGIDLADGFGDAGWYFYKESWINEFTFNEMLSIVSRQKDFIPKDIDGPENKNPEMVTDTLKLSILKGNSFITTIFSCKDKNEYQLTNWK